MTPGPSLSLEEIKALTIGMDDWYWVSHPDTGFNGQIGVLEFIDGKSAYAPEKIQVEAPDGAKDWFEPDGGGSVTQIKPVPPWIPLYCWKANGFTIQEMLGKQTEWDDYESP